eukprot:5145064-Karenia_brevis.AAC.1
MISKTYSDDFENVLGRARKTYSDGLRKCNQMNLESVLVCYMWIQDSRLQMAIGAHWAHQAHWPWAKTLTSWGQNKIRQSRYDHQGVKIRSSWGVNM